MVAQDEKYSVCHAPYLRNHTSYDFHLWYLDVSISSFFHFFNILIFRVVLGGGKGAKKIAQNDKKFCLLHAIFQEPYIISLSFVVHKCKIITSLVISFVFSKFWFLRVKGQKITQNDKSPVFCTLCLRNHTSYDLDLWYTCVSRCFLHFFQILIVGINSVV